MEIRETPESLVTMVHPVIKETMETTEMREIKEMR